MRILITGAGGFVGAHLLNYLVKFSQEKHTYYALIHNTSRLDFIKNLSFIYETNFKNPDFHYLIGDINDYEFMERIFLEEEIELVIHLAAQPIVSKAEKNKLNTVKTNILGTANILELVHKTVCKMIHQSTDKVYGEKENASINDPIAPVDFYGITKAAAESLVKFYQQKYRDDIIIIRPCNIFGLDPNLNRLIPDTIISCVNDKNPIINSAIDGKYPLRQFIYIFDYCQFVLNIINYNKFVEPIINITSPFIFNTKEVAYAVLENFPDLKLEFKEIRHVKEIKHQYMDPTEQFFPFGMLYTELGIAIRETIRHYRLWMNKEEQK